MNIRKAVDYTTMFTALDKLVAADLPQMELYCEIGRLVSGRPEKGAAVAAAEYLSTTYPDTTGFSPRNLRRMREFYRAYESVPEVLAQAMTISWTQNIVILEAELTVQERIWYIRAVQRFGWSKVELQRQIAASTHMGNALDFEGGMCYTEENSDSMGCAENDKSAFCVPREYRDRISESIDTSGFAGLTSRFDTDLTHGIYCYYRGGKNEKVLARKP